MPTLGLVMIARDAEAGITRALDSLRGVVDDLLVLDTGSVDATVRLAEAAGARVEHFTWIDDFSAARNAALASSPTDWHLVLDADEWLAEGADALRAARQRRPDFIGLLSVDSSFDSPSGVQQAATALPRLLPRGTRYAGRVHEHPVSDLPRETLAVTLGHDGYRQAPLKAKDGRNQRLLSLALAESPNDAYLQYQAGKNHEVHDRFAQAAPLYRRALDHGPRTAVWRHDLVVRSVFTLKQLGLYDDAVQLAETEMHAWPDSPDLFFAIGDLLLDWAATQPSRAADLLPMAADAWRRCLAIGENPSLEGAVAGRGSHLAAHNLALVEQYLRAA